MFHPPMTKEQARAYRYGAWAGDPNGSDFDQSKCAYEVSAPGRGVRFYQCTRRAGKGPSELYCTIHAKRFQLTPKTP